MRKKLKEHKFFILAIFLMTGMSLAGWAFAFHYDNKAKAADLQKELKNDLQATKAAPSTLDHSKIILLLVSTGLIGFFGVRRKINPVKTFVTDNRSKIKLRINLLTEDNLES
jgi:cbb3-type cytochrome oxidase subunit 3